MAEDSDPSIEKELEILALQRFGTLSEAELRVLRAIPKGETARCGPNSSATANDPAKADAWGSEREIRAGLISWLCVSTEAAKRIDPAGIQVLGAKIGGRLNLFFVAISFPLLFQLCRFDDDIDLKFATVPALNLSGSWIRSLIADGVHVRGDISIGNGFTSRGHVRVLDAQIGGSLDCRGGIFRNPGEIALAADRAEIKKSVLLDEGFSADGEVRLPSAQIGAQLGDDRGARRVLFEMEDRRRREQDHKWYQRCLNQALRRTIGYGLMSWWALAWLLALLCVGFLLFGCGYFGGAIVPSEREAYNSFELSGQAPPYYPRFNALAYSFEHTFPLVTLGVKDHWTPKLGPPGIVPETESVILRSARDLRLIGHYPFRLRAPEFLRYWLWFQTLAGWVLATLFVAGLTGIVRSGQQAT